MCDCFRYILHDYKPELITEYVSEKVRDQLESAAQDEEEASGPPNKKIKLKGRNKQRPKGKKIDAGDKLCSSVLTGRVCNFGDKCKFSHDKAKFVANKPEDIGPKCYLYETYGKCKHGIACRFGKSHLTEDLQNIVNEEKYKENEKEDNVTNVLNKDLQVKLWKKKYDFSKADKVVQKICPLFNDQKRRDNKKNKEDAAQLGQINGNGDTSENSHPVTDQAVGDTVQTDVSSSISCENTAADLPMPEKKKVP